MIYSHRKQLKAENTKNKHPQEDTKKGHPKWIAFI